MSFPGPVTALVDFRSPDPENGVPALRLAFGAPMARLRATRHDEVAPLLDAVAAHAREGRWCVGSLRYEAAAAFDRALVTHEVDGPLASFAVYDAPLAADDPAALAAWAPAGSAARVDWHGGFERAAFDAAIARIHAAIADGDYYQVNLTAPLRGRLEGDPFALFAALRRAQPGAYAALLAFDDAESVLSVSPELFFDWRDGRLLARPMKGTAPRGATPAEDAENAARLAASEKERAENLMIVDLLRNDLSRVAEPRSVTVPRLFETRAWPTVWQMSSDVVACTRAVVRLRDVFGALFPCGSVTGAPKVRSMRAIRALETAPRGVYCGAVGVVAPGGAATFNVPIRTLALRGDAATCGIGSGITADAGAEGEWAEWRHKRAFVDRASHAFELLETLRLEEGAFVNGEAHLARLAGAAAHFGFEARDEAAREALAALARAHPRGTWRVRLLVDAGGRARGEAHAFAADVAASPGARPLVRLAAAPLVGSDSEFVRHKTTRRAHYDAFAPAAGDPTVFDVLLWNERGELTEFTRGNVAVRLGGRWYTPPLSCGLLPGVGRAVALAERRVAERVLPVESLAEADELAFLNSLRGWVTVRIA